MPRPFTRRSLRTFINQECAMATTTHFQSSVKCVRCGNPTPMRYKCGGNCVPCRLERKRSVNARGYMREERRERDKERRVELVNYWKSYYERKRETIREYQAKYYATPKWRQYFRDYWRKNKYKNKHENTDAPGPIEKHCDQDPDSTS